MSESSARLSPGTVAAMLLAFLATIVFGIVMVRTAPRSSTPAARSGAVTSKATAPPATPGVRATITAGGVEVRRTLPAASFRLEPGQTLDARLPAGPFTAAIEVVFDPGRAGKATIGAQVRNAQLIIRRGTTVLASGYAGDEAGLVWPTADVFPFGLSSTTVLTFEFTAVGDGPHAFRALWQPDESLVPLPLPAVSSSLLDEPALRGMVLAQKRNCAACHDAGDRRAAALTPHPGPRLGQIGARARPGWLRDWLRDPAAVKPGTRMPGLAHGGGLDDEAIEDLTHFLVAMGGPIAPARAPIDENFVATGRVAYHEVGCVACHGPLEPLSALPGGRAAGAAPWRAYAPLAASGRKTTVAPLSAFLRDPLATHPGGLMPGQDLGVIEADAIASYLIARDPGPDRDEQLDPDPVRVERGRALFAATGCAACHDLGPERPPVASTLAAPPLADLAAAGAAGCLADAPPAGVPDFDLTAAQRESLRVFLDGLAARRSDDVPLDDLRAALVRLDCVACHVFHGHPGPEAAIESYFVTRGEADLGDEGRLPPVLTDAGGRLSTSWMRDVLVGGERARPYIAARMPSYGDPAVGRLPELLAASAGATSLLDAEPAFSIEHAQAGRELVGAGAFNCIQCHEIAGQPSTGSPGPDLARMPGRLHYESFARWLHDPARMRPGTRMPSFFVLGRSAFTDFYGGRADAQIGAVWSYLSQGDALALPDGLTDPSGWELVVTDEPVVFRTFMKDAGVRAIACGFPEQIHCAFDADRCVLGVVWEGRFLSAQGAWGARGGSETNPDGTVWTAPPGPLLDIVSASAEPTAHRFRGYDLDASRRPILRYDLSRGGTVVAVAEAPAPVFSSAGARLVRAFTLSGPPGTVVAIDAQGVTLRGDAVATDPGSGRPAVRLDDSGGANFEVVVSW